MQNDEDKDQLIIEGLESHMLVNTTLSKRKVRSVDQASQTLGSMNTHQRNAIIAGVADRSTLAQCHRANLDFSKEISRADVIRAIVLFSEVQVTKVEVEIYLKTELAYFAAFGWHNVWPCLKWADSKVAGG